MNSNLINYSNWLRDEERSSATIEKYLHNVRCFYHWLGDQKLEKESMIRYKATLTGDLPAGVTLTGFYTSRAMLNKLRKNAAIQQAINGNTGVGMLVSNSDLRAYLSEEFGLNEIIVNDLTYGVEGTPSNGRPHVVAKRYFPESKVTFFSTNNGGKVGDGLWGDPPETDVAQFLDVTGSSVSPYVYITQWAEKDPAVLWTKASALFIPVLYNPNSLFIATATETAGG